MQGTQDRLIAVKRSGLRLEQAVFDHFPCLRVDFSSISLFPRVPFSRAEIPGEGRDTIGHYFWAVSGHRVRRQPNTHACVNTTYEMSEHSAHRKNSVFFK